MKNLSIIVLLLCVYYTGILLFTKGFLLKRIVISRNSSGVSLSDNGSPNIDRGTVDNLESRLPAYFKKAVIIVIDALRYDFVSSDADRGFTDLPYYRNKLTILAKTVRVRPNNARMYHFIADPPTTTLQRLKGLTTGSLPTFVDAGANFASTEITEDNIIDRFVAMNKNITFMGDDTWQSLFPKRFSKSFPFPSFNVKDLDTVDAGVSKHLVKEMVKNDWDILIGHFLGVDHCGHTFGPNHPVMANKLQQMDAELRSVMNAMDDDTILFVLGDHGMTSTGDHGGDSDDELDAALFVYSPRSITDSAAFTDHNINSISQVDLVPTISLLMGAPIPFSNLGLVIEDLFNVSKPVVNSSTDRQLTSTRRLTEALRRNAHQVKQYTVEYNSVSDELPRAELDRLDKLLGDADREYELLIYSKSITAGDVDEYQESTRLKDLHSRYKEYVTGVRSLCRSIWSKFDLVAMGLGGAVTICGFLLNIAMMMTQSMSVKAISAVAVYAAAVLLMVSAHLLDASSWFEGHHDNALIILGCSILVLPFVAFIVFRKHFKVTTPSRSELFALVLYALQTVSLLSNSFVVYEDRVVPFFVLSLLLVQLASVVRSSVSEVPSVKRLGTGVTSRGIKFSWPNIAATLVLTAVLSLCLRLSAVFHSCREEQIDCQLSWFAQPLSAVVAEYSQFKLLRFLLSVSSLVALFYAIFRWLRHQGNLNGNACSVLTMSYVVPSAVAVVCLYWMVDGLLPQNDRRLFGFVLTALPRLVYVLAVIVIVVSVISPLCIYLIPPKTEDDVASRLRNIPFTGADSVPQIYNHIRFNWRSLFTAPKSTSPTSCNSTPIVFGLATVYSSSLLVPLVAIAVIIVVLLGDNVAPSVLMFFVMMYALMELHSQWMRMDNDHDRSTLVNVSFVSAVVFVLLTSYSFFSTGHQATIAGIRWDAAFHGFLGNHSTVWVPALLVILNTFGTQILSTLSLPLLIYWPFTRGRRSAVKVASEEKTAADSDDKGEFVLNEDDGDKLKYGLYMLLLKYTLLTAFKMLAAMCCVTLHRRHLMVWKIFAPRFVYCGASLFVTSAVSVVVYLFVVRVNRAVLNWVSVLCNDT